MMRLTTGAPVYTKITRQVAVLQQLQLLADQPRTVTLEDMIGVLASMQQEYSPSVTLEEIIQKLSGVQLKAQFEARRQRRWGWQYDS
jgi:hypothetical protein